MTSYTIWTPSYTHRSGGVRALYKLRDLLVTEGQDVEIATFDNDHPIRPWERPDAITVYPEIVVGNPAKATRFLHWMLNRAEPGGPCDFQWLPSMGDREVLHVPIMDTEAFCPRTGPRSGTAYWAGKCTPAQAVRHVPDGVDVMPRNDPDTALGLGEYLGSLEYLVSLDPFSAINIEAVMCGTPVRIYTEYGWSRETLTYPPLVYSYGMAFDDEPWSMATDTVDLAFDAYVKSQEVMIETVRSFIRITQRHFGV